MRTAKRPTYHDEQIENQPANDPLILSLNHSDCVTIDLFSKISGLTPAAVRNMIHEGKWLEGRQYFRRCGRVYVSVKGYEKWVATGLA